MDCYRGRWGKASFSVRTERLDQFTNSNSPPSNIIVLYSTYSFRASLLSCPLQNFQMPAVSSICARIGIPLATILARPLEKSSNRPWCFCDTLLFLKKEDPEDLYLELFKCFFNAGTLLILGEAERQRREKLNYVF